MLVAGFGFGSFLYLPVPAVFPRNKPAGDTRCQEDLRLDSRWGHLCPGHSGQCGNSCCKQRDGFFCSLMQSRDLGDGGWAWRGLWQGCWPCQSERQDKEAVLHLVQKGSRQGSDSILHLSLLRWRCFQVYLHSMN